LQKTGEKRRNDRENRQKTLEKNRRKTREKPGKTITISVSRVYVIMNVNDVIKTLLSEQIFHTGYHR
jgi:hypothetical protein